MGPPAEHAVLSGFQKLTDFRVRIELCHVLSAIGTEASLNALREVAGREGDGVVAGAAADALRGISERE